VLLVGTSALVEPHLGIALLSRGHIKHSRLKRQHTDDRNISENQGWIYWLEANQLYRDEQPGHRE